MPEESWWRVKQEKHKEMLHVLEFPYNGESPKRLTTAQAISPNPLFFVRNHGGIPDIDIDKWDLKIEGTNESKTITSKDLQDESKFPRVKKMCTIQCSGTRRHEQIDLYAGEGDEMINAPWAEGKSSILVGAVKSSADFPRRCNWNYRMGRCHPEKRAEVLRWRRSQREGQV